MHFQNPHSCDITICDINARSTAVRGLLDAKAASDGIRTKPEVWHTANYAMTERVQRERREYRFRNHSHAGSSVKRRTLFPSLQSDNLPPSFIYVPNTKGKWCRVSLFTLVYSLAHYGPAMKIAGEALYRDVTYHLNILVWKTRQLHKSDSDLNC